MPIEVLEFVRGLLIIPSEVVFRSYLNVTLTNTTWSPNSD